MAAPARGGTIPRRRSPLPRPPPPWRPPVKEREPHCLMREGGPAPGGSRRPPRQRPCRRGRARVGSRVGSGASRALQGARLHPGPRRRRPPRAGAAGSEHRVRALPPCAAGLAAGRPPRGARGARRVHSSARVRGWRAPCRAQTSMRVERVSFGRWPVTARAGRRVSEEAPRQRPR